MQKLKTGRECMVFFVLVSFRENAYVDDDNTAESVCSRLPLTTSKSKQYFYTFCKPQICCRSTLYKQCFSNYH